MQAMVTEADTPTNRDHCRASALPKNDFQLKKKKGRYRADAADPHKNQCESDPVDFQAVGELNLVFTH